MATPSERQASGLIYGSNAFVFDTIVLYLSTYHKGCHIVDTSINTNTTKFPLVCTDGSTSNRRLAYSEEYSGPHAC